jgi:hypothetical protein
MRDTIRPLSLHFTDYTSVVITLTLTKEFKISLPTVYVTNCNSLVPHCVRLQMYLTCLPPYSTVAPLYLTA